MSNRQPPTIEDWGPPRGTKAKPRKRPKKQYRLEFRVSPKSPSVQFWDSKSWVVWQRYATKRAQRDALAALRRSHSTMLGRPYLEFRIPESE